MGGIPYGTAGTKAMNGVQTRVEPEPNSEIVGFGTLERFTESFYRASGAKRIGVKPSTSIPERELPLMELDLREPRRRNPDSRVVG